MILIFNCYEGDYPNLKAWGGRER